jgi:hypothetical protein
MDHAAPPCTLNAVERPTRRKLTRLQSITTHLVRGADVETLAQLEKWCNLGREKLDRMHEELTSLAPGGVGQQPSLQCAKTELGRLKDLQLQMGSGLQRLKTNIRKGKAELSLALVVRAADNAAYNSFQCPLVRTLTHTGWHVQSSLFDHLGLRQLWIVRGVCKSLKAWCERALRNLPLILVVAGLKDESDGGDATNTLHIGTMEWTALEDGNTPRFAYGGCKLVDGMMLVASDTYREIDRGFAAGASVEVSDPARWPSWMRRARAFAPLCAVSAGDAGTPLPPCLYPSH